MSNAVNNVNKVNAGTCPHGCAPSACPICSGMGGGGLRAGERVQKPGELSYHECAMIGAMMKARAEAAKLHESNLLSHVQNVKSFENHLENVTQKLSQFASQLQKTFFFRPIAFIVQNVIVPIINGIKNAVVLMKGFGEKLSQLKIDIQDKLNAIFGEAKAFVEKKASELVSSIKSKFELLFKVFKRNKTRDDETKIDEDKKIFRLKSFIHKLLKRKDDTEN